jgi:transposase
MKEDTRAKRDRRILEVYAQCGKIRQTALRTGHSVNTVRKVLRGESRPRRSPRKFAKRPSKLDPYRAVIRRLVLEDKLTAVLVLEEIQALGYDGGYSILKDFIRSFRPQPSRLPTTYLEHKPGAEAQMDWSPYRVWLADVECVVHAFSMVLPFSRFMVVRFALDETLETLVALHEEAFAIIGAIVPLLSYDNMTTVGRHVGPGEVWINPRFKAYADGCGFDIRIIAPGKPNQHASVERPFGYIENNCLRRRRFRFDDLADLNRHAEWWCNEVANVRIHGTTRQRPIDLLKRERLYLKPLPAQRCESYRAVERTVWRDFCVRVDNSWYSVHPRHIGKNATVHIYTDRLEVFIDDTLEAVHVRSAEPHKHHVLPEHEDAFKQRTPSRLLLRQAFVRLGEVAQGYYEGLKAQRGRGAGHHIQRILKLADRYGADIVCGAMAHSARYGNYSADAVVRVISGRAMPGSKQSSTPASTPPERIQEWIQGIDVERRDLSDFDAIVDRFGEPDDPEDDDAES